MFKLPNVLLPEKVEIKKYSTILNFIEKKPDIIIKHCTAKDNKERYFKYFYTILLYFRMNYEIKKVGEYKKVANWFLDDVKNTESSDFMEVALSEFFVQGLELDWTIVIWDADFRAQFDVNQGFRDWEYYGGFDGIKWEKNNSQQSYQLNAYRVLLTRARRGMIIVVPEGNVDDPSRAPEFYNSTYEYIKSIVLDIVK